jgi:hypothetical protein
LELMDLNFAADAENLVMATMGQWLLSTFHFVYVICNYSVMIDYTLSI